MGGHNHFSDKALDGLSIFVAVGAVMQWLPPLAAIFTIIYTGIRIYETRTVQKLLGNVDAK